MAFFVVGTGCSGDADAPWPQWRGPRGNGIYEGGPLPTVWGKDSPNLRWKAVIPGVGSSSPVVGGGQVFVTTSYPVDPSAPDGDHHRVVLAYDLANGDLRWQREVLAAPAEKRHWLNTLAGATPATDGRSVYAYFGSLLVRLDADGKVLWSREIDPDYDRFTRYGAASSLVLVGDRLLLAQDKERARTVDVGWLTAFDAESGEQIWRTEWTHTCCSYSTPVVVERSGRREVLFAHSGDIVGYDFASGEKLWRHTYPMLQMVSTPVIEGEFLAVLGGADNRRGNVGLAITGSGADTHVERLWHEERMAPQVSSPVLYEGLLYSLTVPGVLVARDPENGEVVWRHRLSRGRNHASLMAGDGKLIASSTSGVVSVVAAGTEFRLLGENELGEKGTTASPAAGGGCLILRGEQHLFCIEPS